MKEIAYAIHGALEVRILGLSPWTLEAFNCLYSYFRPRGPGTGAPDITVEIGPFRPDLSRCANVDHRYFVRRGYLYFRGTDKGLEWEAEVSGLDEPGSGPLHVRFWAPFRNRFKFPWTLFPDLVLTLYVLNPLLEMMLWKRGYFLLHSAGVEKDGRACLIAGRGGAHKTTFTMDLLRKGWRLLGDDMVILHGGKALPFPSVAQELDYLVRSRKTEDLGLRGRFGLFRHLAANRPLSLPIGEAAPPSAVNLVMVRDVERPSLRAGWDKDGLVSSLAANHLMERICYVDFKFSTLSFLEAYEYVYPEAAFRRYPGDLSAALRGHVGEAAFRVLDLPFRWDARNLDLIAT